MGNQSSSETPPKTNSGASMNMNMNSGPTSLYNIPAITKTSSLLEKEQYATTILMEELHRLQIEQSNRGHEIMQDNSAFEYTYEGLNLPKDNEGYVQAFSLNEEAEIRAFFKKYGVVVIKDILTASECQKSEDEVWEFIERHSRVKRNEPASYEYWPALKQLGILGNDVILSKQMCENRQNPNVYRAFSIVLHDDKILLSLGRGKFKILSF